MPNCPRCEKPVYFAERVTSLGKDWHRPCLRCENSACNKVLTAGGHCEHDGKPYCSHCYAAMFGPRGYGHGGTESHTFHQGRTGRVDGGRVLNFDLATLTNYNYPNYP
ncbi:hypothetical protein WR25_19961 [Diploscapter pachys]|uniref:Cysteine-rich protein 1 n=1 Tax=Diploscapter pachys TaxID=2018661 RepID=A0A2A2KV57_9BILA|nr:hypothetical protein WR25_19961 [Diploscapter pachys]